MSDTLRPENVTDEHLEYLDDLRESGETNMFGAGPFVANAFGLDSKEAREIVTYWMDSFGNSDR
jgi:uncharacterized protein YciI